MAKLSPNAGGCWYCSTDNPPLSFCFEFDTYIHIDCIKQQIDGLFPDEIDQELEIIAREFNLLKELKNAKARKLQK